ncbi:MAG TPA: cyclase family protein [Bacteroidales bacterium]|nr:cyclase family protein [Bacteroidales bacterium]HPS49602.1 cyclase family protein [Bacteroidales bacterium]
MKHNLILLLLFGLYACSQSDLSMQLQKASWIDLSHEYDSNTVYWPTNVKFRHDTVFCGINSQNYFYASFKYSAEEHGGTHFDAPLHFHQGGESIEKIGMERLHGPAVVVDVTGQTSQNRDYLVGKTDLENWEKIHGRIPDGAVILLRTGWGKFYHDHLKYTGTLKTGVEGVRELHFPGLDPQAAKWIAENRKVVAIGIDTPSIDNGQSTEFLTHRILCASGITAYENIARLDEVPEKGAYIVAFPMKIKGGSGAPLRIAAILP